MKKRRVGRNRPQGLKPIRFWKIYGTSCPDTKSNFCAGWKDSRGQEVKFRDKSWCGVLEIRGMISERQPQILRSPPPN
jgi:hypothetical protein